jgi:hypothetical protein
MSQPTAPEPARDGSDEFELLSTPPTSADISGELKARKSTGTPLVTLSLVGVVLAVGGFIGGVAVGKSHASASKSSAAAGAPSSTRSRGQFGGQNGGQSGAPAGTRGGTVTGTVQKIDGTTITVVDATGKVTKVTTSDQTTITVGKPGTVADLSTGAQVTVVGTPGSDGVVTARSVLSGVSLGGLGGARTGRTPGATPSPTNG